MNWIGRPAATIFRHREWVFVHRLFEDEFLLVVNKPCGVFTQAAPGVPSLHAQLLEDSTIGQSGPQFIGLVHRLDRPTSGVIIFAKTAASLRQLNSQFHLRTVRKEYLAIVNGNPPNEGLAIDWMRKIVDVAKAEICDEQSDGAKQARLRWKKVAHSNDCSMLRIELDTGRMHQIRLQLATRGWPVVGDPIYSPDLMAGCVTAASRDISLFGLHAATLELRHPKTAKLLKFVAGVPESWHQSFSGLVEESKKNANDLSNAFVPINDSFN